jgi:hypothetical protein
VDATTQISTCESSLRYEGWRIVAVCFLVATFGRAFGFYGQSVYLAEPHRLEVAAAALIMIRGRAADPRDQAAW